MEPGVIAFAGLHPHPPVIVPEVGRAQLASCRASHDACVRFGERLVSAKVDRLLLVSPHAPREFGAFGIFCGDRLRGDLTDFGAPSAAVELENDLELGAELAARANVRDLEMWAINERLDHGALVPLVFITRAGFAGGACVTSLPRRSTVAALIEFGRAVRAAALALPGRTAIVASGDMTHRALPGAPAGFHEDAVRFDRALCELIAAGRLDDIPRIDPELRELAAEDAVESSTIVSAALDFRARGAEVLSYEHPFGVGYLVAVFHDEGAS